MKTTLTITEKQHGKRIDVLCAEQFSQISRSQWQKRGHFLCDDQEKAPKTKVSEGQYWTVSCPEEAAVDLTDVQPWDHPLRILQESASWVALDKPDGIAVHPSSSDPSQQTVVNALVHHFGKKLADNYDTIDGVQIPRPGLVHRLDKTTSGVLLIAKTNTTHRYLQDHWSDTTKIYKALVTGTPPQKGRIKGGLSRDPQNRKKMKISGAPQAKAAETSFRVLKSVNDQHLLEVQIHTGRTHQIRAHLSSIGLPVVGDELYGGVDAPRVMLHAHRISFPDPDQAGQTQVVESPVPEALEL